MLDELVPRTFEGASGEVIRKVHFFEARLQHEETLPEWPSTLAAAISTMAFSVLSTVAPPYLGLLIKAAVTQLFPSGA